MVRALFYAVAALFAVLYMGDSRLFVYLFVDSVAACLYARAATITAIVINNCRN
jgi:hypothetical protein